MSTLYVDNLQPNLGSQVEIPDLKPLAGQVVQCVQYYDASTSKDATASTSYVGSAVRKTITPKYADSLVIVQFSTSMVDVETANYMAAKMYVNGSAMSGSSVYHVGYQAPSHARYSPFVFQGQFACTSTAPLEFRVYFKSGNGSSASISHSGSSAGLTLWEIAQ